MGARRAALLHRGWRPHFQAGPLAEDPQRLSRLLGRPCEFDHIIAGSDGGITITRDGGRNWEYINNIPIGQYTKSHTTWKPYNLCGGLQDNNSWCGPSGTVTTPASQQ